MHFEVNGANGSRQAYRRLQLAYRVLIDPERRGAYDAAGVDFTEEGFGLGEAVLREREKDV